jgi:hypothetical protein
MMMMMMMMMLVYSNPVRGTGGMTFVSHVTLDGFLFRS